MGKDIIMQSSGILSFRRLAVIVLGEKESKNNKEGFTINVIDENNTKHNDIYKLLKNLTDIILIKDTSSVESFNNLLTDNYNKDITMVLEDIFDTYNVKCYEEEYRSGGKIYWEYELDFSEVPEIILNKLSNLNDKLYLKQKEENIKHIDINKTKKILKEIDELEEKL